MVTCDDLIDVLSDKQIHTKRELIEKLGLKTKHPERKLRRLIQEVNMHEGPYSNMLIIGTSDISGYRLATRQEDLKHFLNERRSRAEEILKPCEKAERILLDIENGKQNEHF